MLLSNFIQNASTKACPLVIGVGPMTTPREAHVLFHRESVLLSSIPPGIEQSPFPLVLRQLPLVLHVKGELVSMLAPVLALTSPNVDFPNHELVKSPFSNPMCQL